MAISFLESTMNDKSSSSINGSNDNIAVAAFATDEPYTLIDDGRYKTYNDYYDESYSTVSIDKVVKVDPHQINITQEENSQYIPFKINRYWDGIDLTTMLIQIHYINALGNSDVSTAVNVRYNSDSITFAWLVTRNVTIQTGKIAFEITAIGENEKGEKYKWRTRPDRTINILEALTYDAVIEPTEDWYTSFEDTMNALINRAQEYANEAKASADSVDVDAIKNDVRADVVTDLNSNLNALRTDVETDLNTFKSEIESDMSTFEESVGTRIDTLEEDLSAQIAGINSLTNLDVEYDDETGTLYFYDGKETRSREGRTLIDSVRIDRIEDIKLGYEINDGKGYITIAQGDDKPFGILEIGNTNPSDEWTTSLLNTIQTQKIAPINYRIGEVEDGLTQSIAETNETVSGLSSSISDISNTVSGLSTSVNDVKLTAEAAQQTASGLVDTVSGVSESIDSIVSDVEKLKDQKVVKYGLTYENNVLTWTEDEESTSWTIQGGGGGGGTSATNLVVERITPSPLVLTSNDKVEIQINFSSTDEDNQTLDADYTWKIGTEVIMQGTLNQGINTFDLTEFCSVGTQKLVLTVIDEGGSSNVKSWTVQKVDVRIESTFNDKYYTEIGKSVLFTYTPYGAISKVVHFKLDGVEDTVTTTASGTSRSYTIKPQSHGSHLLEVWITAMINSVEIETEHIFKDIVWFDAEKDEDGNYQSPIIGCKYRYDYYGILSGRQYDTNIIEYNVFDPSTNSPTVKKYVDDVLVGTEVLTQSNNTWNYKTSDVGLHVLKLECKNTIVEIHIDIEALDIDVDPIIDGLEIDFNPTGITNNSDNRIWSNENYHMTVSDNFDWSNGGYQTDENGDTYFLIKSGTNVTFDYFMFDGGLKNNPSITGQEMKLVFKTENVQDVTTTWFSNVENEIIETADGQSVKSVGIQLNVHDGWLKTDKASSEDIVVEGGEEEDTIAASNTYLYMPYSEEDIIELDINIDPVDQDDSTAQAFVMAYEDGVPSKAYVYDGGSNGDRFYHYTPQPIVIGSQYCDVRIYRMKIYSTTLSTESIMKNFIADSRDSSTMLARYDKNSIYYNSETRTYSPYSGEGVLDPEKLAPIIPDVKVLMLDTDHFTTSKKTFVKSTLRCIHAPGGKIYPGDAHLDNWFFENGWHSGQGTTSDKYGNSSRNVDFLFNCDGIHKPSDKVNAEADYVSKVTLGYKTENPEVKVVTDWKGDDGKVTLTRTSVPNNFFNFKVNVASSENVNNALLQKRYDDFLPYTSPAKKRDERIKNDMEFVPAVLFIRENNPDLSTHNEFNDTEWHFYSLGNIGDSKKTDYTRAYDPEDMNEFTIEISDNTKNNATFQTGVYLDERGNRVIEAIGDKGVHTYIYPITNSEWSASNNRYNYLYNEGFDGDHSFEPRYACCGDYRDGKIVNDTTGKATEQIVLNNDVWRAFYRWVVTSTDEQFVNELDQWCVRDAVEYFYAFTHMFTMMDNRAKNTFWHFAKTGVFREVSRPVSELLHIYCEKVGDEYIPTTDASIVGSKKYYTQYAFDMCNYDNDTSLGIKCQCQVKNLV